MSNIGETSIKISPSKNEEIAEKEDEKKPKKPKMSVMIAIALNELEQPRRATSLQSIKKYIASTYDLEIKKIAKAIRKNIVQSVASGEIIQVTGKGAQGSFKLAKVTKVKKETKKQPKLKRTDEQKVPAKTKMQNKPKTLPKSPKKTKTTKKTEKEPTKKAKLTKRNKTNQEPTMPKKNENLKKSPRKTIKNNLNAKLPKATLAQSRISFVPTPQIKRSKKNKPKSNLKTSKIKNNSQNKQ